MSFALKLRLPLALAVFAWAGWAMRGYITDDTFIHLRYAENLLRFGEFSFNPGDATYGATSPLWIFGLALLLKLGLSPFAAAATLGALSGALVIVLVDRILERMTYQAGWKLIFLIVVAADAWFLRWSWSGMETPLATAMLLVLLWPLFSGRDVGWGVTRRPLWQRYLAWGVAAGMAGLVRPEYLLVAPLALPILLWFEYFRAGAIGGREARVRARPHQPIVAAVVGWVLVVGPWLFYAWRIFGRVLPGTASAKSSAATFDPAVVWGHLWQGVTMLAATQGAYWVGLVLLILLVLVRHRGIETGGAWERMEMDEEDRDITPGSGPWSVWGPVALVGVTAVWTVALLGGYAVRQVWLISRYVCPLSPVLLLAMSAVTEWLMRGSAIDRRTLLYGRGLIVAASLATLLGNVWLLQTRVVPHARSFPVGVRTCYLGLGEWLRANTPDDAVVAALDIGAVGYASGRRVLDLMGLVSPEVLAVGAEIGFAEMVESGAWLRLGPGGRVPDYFVDRAEGAPRWAGRTVDGVTFELLDTCSLPGVGLRESQPWTVALYRLVDGGTGVRSSAGG
ncbi:MAG: hypothetical protein KDH20_01925 [Rhodocyclaceae bacterium]|nr:hypothetical protein [Rhodocyclaceae bacterium]